MRSRTFAWPIAVTLAVCPPLTLAAETIRPGYWESVNRVLSPIQTTTTDRRCIHPRDIDKFLSCHINHHYDCVCPDESAANGEIRFRGQCIDKKGQKVGLSGRGAYTATTLTMTADFSFRYFGLPISGSASTDAHRIGDVCPATAKQASPRDPSPPPPSGGR